MKYKKICQCCLNWIGPEIMCTVFGEIWLKYAGIGAKPVFWRTFKMAQMGVAYVARWVMVQGILGKNNLGFMTYGSRVISQRPVIVPPWGRSGGFGPAVHCWHPGSVCADFGVQDWDNGPWVTDEQTHKPSKSAFFLTVKVNQRTWFLGRISSFVNKSALKTLAGAPIQSYFDYACTSWFSNIIWH